MQCRCNVLHADQPDRRGVMVRILSDDMQADLTAKCGDEACMQSLRSGVAVQAKQQNSAVPDLIREGLQLRDLLGFNGFNVEGMCCTG